MITEALLEMYYFKPLIDSIKNKYGADFTTLLKPSPQNEAWVGFDQGWVGTSLTTSKLFNELRQTIQNDSQNIQDFYFGYFLQFKVVEKMVRRSTLVPEGYTTPYLRVPLSLEPNTTTNLSQHETLLRLSNIQNASVYYACPMIFEMADLMKEATLDELRLVDIKNAPSDWITNAKHYIMFQDKNDMTPYWKSNPVQTKAISVTEWADTSLNKMTASQLNELIEKTFLTVKEACLNRMQTILDKSNDPYTQLMPPGFTILHFKSK